MKKIVSLRTSSLRLRNKVDFHLKLTQLKNQYHYRQIYSYRAYFRPLSKSKIILCAQ